MQCYGVQDVYFHTYNSIWKTTVQIKLFIRTDISCNCFNVCTSGDCILSHLWYEHF